MTIRRFRNAVPTDASRCFDIEAAAYGGEEAATFEKIARRIGAYPQGFLVLEVDATIAGFINSGCAHDVEMSDDDFKELIEHDPAAVRVAIMSVVVDPVFQGRGLPIALMDEFIKRMIFLGKKSIHLMCREHHVPLYERFGFCYAKPSASEHGGGQWHEMMRDLPNA